MPVNYLVAHLFSKTETAFKYHGLVIGILFAIKFVIELLITGAYSRDDTEKRQKKLANVFLKISPFECLQELIAAALAEGEFNFYIKRAEKWQVYLYMAAQTIVFLTLTIVIDHIKMNLFKGKDQKKVTEERKQLDENQDVIAHRE